MRILQHFPALSNVSIDYIWRGTAWLNSSLLPKIYELEEGIFAIQACNGRGLANNLVLGKEMAEALVQNNMALLCLQVEKPKPIKSYFIAQHIPSLMMAWAFIKSKL
jgi:glycine/D-amino acid oxidase-like deaminating enzyme